ncbi:hypothetical protein [Microcoleus sp. herbarium14]|uniref:hypothetical protein n=1 Tax=Microcoleus sp. herbarium14 TaxID=3055439 RepID=UPI002FD0ACD1
MTITIEKFDRKVYTTEKRSFQICCFSSVYNVSEGTYTDANDDELWTSPLWRNWRTIEQQRQEFWAEIKKYLPAYLEGDKDMESRRLVTSNYFYCLITMTKDYLASGKLKLLYISDRDHAEMIARCIHYLADRLRPF